MFPLLAQNGEVTMFEVAKILSADSSLVSSDLLLMSEADFRRFFLFPASRITDLVVTVGNSRELNTIARKVLWPFPIPGPLSGKKS